VSFIFLTLIRDVVYDKETVMESQCNLIWDGPNIWHDPEIKSKNNNSSSQFAGREVVVCNPKLFPVKDLKWKMFFCSSL